MLSVNIGGGVCQFPLELTLSEDWENGPRVSTFENLTLHVKKRYFYVYRLNPGFAFAVRTEFELLCMACFAKRCLLQAASVVRCIHILPAIAWRPLICQSFLYECWHLHDYRRIFGSEIKSKLRSRFGGDVHEGDASLTCVRV